MTLYFIFCSDDRLTCWRQRTCRGGYCDSRDELGLVFDAETHAALNTYRLTQQTIRCCSKVFIMIFRPPISRCTTYTSIEQQNIAEHSARFVLEVSIIVTINIIQSDRAIREATSSNTNKTLPYPQARERRKKEPPEQKRMTADPTIVRARVAKCQIDCDVRHSHGPTQHQQAGNSTAIPRPLESSTLRLIE